MRPGTVSKILWHFTGGPLWDETTNKQLTQLKPAKFGYDALKSILTSREVRVGKYHEIVKVTVHKKRKYNIEKKVSEIHENVPVTIKSKPVCCVADIPLQHLSYHAKRYGKIAIGFRRESIIKAGFNPVMYTLENTALLNSIYTGYGAVDNVDPSMITDEVDSFSSEIQSKYDEHCIDEYADISGTEFEISCVKEAQEQIEDSYSNFLPYIKTFDETEFDSIYCEREWRSIKNFDFTLDDIAVIVLPNNQEDFDFYTDFLSSFELPKKITIASWEDLIDH